MRKAFFSIFLAFFTLPAIAQNEAVAERSGYVVHLLNYLGNDYSGAVSNGKVISESEYTEMKNFSENIVKAASELPLEKANKDSLLIYVFQIEKLVGEKANENDVKTACDYAKKYLLKTSGLKTAPSAYPLLSKGKAIYIANCAKCHGDKGFGDGEEGRILDPKPRNFHEEPRMSSLSAFGIFNTVRYGIEGTGMKAIPKLSDDEVWSVAFYVLSLRYTDITNVEAKISLAQIATLSDEELKKIVDSTSISHIRSYEPKLQENLISKAQNYLAQAQEACLNGDLETVEKLVTQAYLEGIEPNEFELKKSHGDLVLDLEKRVADVHSAVKKGDKKAVLDNIKALNELLEITESKLSTAKYSAFLSAFMTTSILLREGLEALLVIIIFMNVLNAGGMFRLKKVVHAGWILSLIGGIALWFLIGKLLAKSPVNIELMEGIMTLSAVVMLLIVGFWMHKRSSIEQWTIYIKKQIRSQSGKASVWGIFTLSFLVVFREIFESILFISTIDLQSRGEHRAYIFAGGLIAFILIILLYQIITRLSRRIPFGKIITFSVIILGVLAVMLTGKGLHSLQEGSLVSQNFISNLPMLDLIGFYPTWETITAQVIMALLVFILYKKSKAS